MATLDELMPNLISAHEVFEQTKLVEVRQDVSGLFLWQQSTNVILKVEVTNTFSRINFSVTKAHLVV